MQSSPPLQSPPPSPLTRPHGVGIASDLKTLAPGARPRIDAAAAVAAQLYFRLGFKVFLRRFRPSVRVDTASGDIFLLKTLFYLWPRQVKPSLGSWSRARRVAFSTAGGRARRPRSRRGRAPSLVPGFQRARPALSPFSPSPSVLASPQAGPSSLQASPLCCQPVPSPRVG